MDCVVQGDLTFQLLEEITDGFSQDRKLGTGSYGKVYMGVQKDGTKIAVKMLYDNPGLDEDQFQNEFNHLKRLQHQNIVQLIGCCYETQEQIVEYQGKFVLAEKRYRALCLEYMHKGSLDKYLSDEYNKHDWPTCYTIIMGICNGLKYLHEELKPPTYHLDLKPANVLLDENMMPKLADFGLSRFFEEEQTRITRSSVGTVGYIPPEYINMGMISVKFDIFSLGVIIIKIMAGRMGYFKIADMSSEQFIELVHGNWRNRTYPTSVLTMESYSKQVKTCIEIALRCVEADRHKRPCIGDIVNTLNDAGTPWSKYLHEELKPPTYHLDLKPANVLLDENMMPKLADFGLSRFFEEEQTRITRSSVGTVGYTPPEYINMGMISVKFDIFSLGVIIIKIMAGRMGYFKIADMSSEQFIELVHGNWRNRTYPTSVLTMESYSKQVKTCIEIALRCVEADRHKRPCIGDIVNTLNDAGTIIHGLPQSVDMLTLDSWSSMQQVSLVSVVTGALEPALEKLSTMLGDEYKLFKGVRSEIRFLINELAAMHAFIQKSEQEDPDLQDKAWMKGVREISYDIDESLNELMQNVENKVFKPYGVIEKIRKSTGKSRKMESHIGSKFKYLQKQITEMNEGYAMYKGCEGFSWTRSVTVDHRALPIIEHPSHLVGIDEPKAELIRLLTEEDECASTQLPKVVSIFGFGGLGKTTLAHELYRELKVQFNCGAFVSVSRNPDMREILRDVLNQVSNQLCGNTESYEIRLLVHKIRDFLKNKRYFIVFDDIWDASTWDDIKCAICWTSCGSRIITTTRVNDVAHSCSSFNGYVYRMSPLSTIHSRQLFYRRLFNSEEDCPLHLVEVSHEILKKCAGLPLAIISISGLLANKISTKDQWDQVLESIPVTLERNYNVEGMMRILLLSYLDLPPHLKTCLLYISVFPKGYIIEKQDLIRRWIAEGFIHKKDRYTGHEFGEKYFNELISRGFIHAEKIDKYDKVKSCRVHDIVLYFIITKSIEENFVTFAGIFPSAIAPQSKVRRLSLQVDKEGNKNLPMGMVLSHTRSLNVFGYSAKIPCLNEFLRLHVLNFRGCNQLLNHHLANIRRLFQLRYLNLRDTGVSELPEQIGHLQCLEMLELRGTNVLKLPEAIVDLRKLVHLLTDTGVKFPDGIAKMQALEVLKHVSALEQSVNFLQELGQLKNLRKLHINFDGFDTGDTMRVRQWMEAIGSSLDKLCTYNIRCLTIVEGGSFLQEVWSPTSSSLQKLITWYSSILLVPNWVGSLVNLQQLRLEVEGVSQEDLCILGGLPSLLILDLIGTAYSEDRLTVNDGVGFPSLSQFCYDIRGEGKDLTFASGSMPKLQKLMIYFGEYETKSLTSDAFDFGIENLPCLTSVKFGVLGSVKSAVEAAKAAMERAASTHPNHPSVRFEYISTSDDA